MVVSIFKLVVSLAILLLYACMHEFNDKSTIRYLIYR